MAGSLMHLINKETGEFQFDLIDNMGDAYEACEDCVKIIKDMADRLIELEEIREDRELVNQYYWTANGEQVGK
jgi:hypothetical protein